MSATDDKKLLAMLVHRGLLDQVQAKAAWASSDPGQQLIAAGACTAAQWEQWRRTDAGTRPELSRYEIGDLLGQGGTARVFRARDKTSGDSVALKILLPELCNDRLAVERFVSEARLLVELRHDGLVRGLRVAREGAVIFLAMQVVPGECLQDRLARGEVLDEDEALRIVVQVAAVLGYLHERGLVHRDVKPGNILWDDDREHAVLIDLGFAARTASDASAQTGTTVGTVHYISPEQAQGAAALDVRADIYSLGATLYHLVTGELPFAGATGEEVIAKQVLESLSSDKIRALQLSPQLHYFIEKMMAKEKEIRFQAPGQLATEVEAYLAARDHERSQTEREPKAGRRRRRRPLF